MNATLDRAGCTAHRHGTISAYINYGCRCPDAREAWRLYYKRWRESRLPPAFTNPVGTIRRIQALYAIGHTSTTIAQHLKINPLVVQTIVQRRRTKGITIRLASLINIAYLQLADTPGPSPENWGRAAARGWPTPQWWQAWGGIDDPDETPPIPDDVICEVAIHRVLTHQAKFTTLHPHEQTHLFAQLRNQGLSDEQIRYRLRLSPGLTARLARQHNQQQETAA